MSRKYIATKLGQDEKAEIAEQVRTYKKYQDLIYNGLYYRLSNPQEENLSAWEFVSKEQGNDVSFEICLKSL